MKTKIRIKNVFSGKKGKMSPELLTQKWIELARIKKK